MGGGMEDANYEIGDDTWTAFGRRALSRPSQGDHAAQAYHPGRVWCGAGWGCDVTYTVDVGGPESVIVDGDRWFRSDWLWNTIGMKVVMPGCEGPPYRWTFDEEAREWRPPEEAVQ